MTPPRFRLCVLLAAVITFSGPGVTLADPAAAPKPAAGQPPADRPDASEPTSPRIEALLSKMTLEEKAGQLSMDTTVTPQLPKYQDIKAQIRAGKLAGVYNVHDIPQAREMQDIAVKESRLGIPLLLAHDIMHGFRTIFPTSIAMASSWDFEAIRKAQRIAAEETTADGIFMTLAPMLDITHDARWGRIVEGVGESSWLASRIGEAEIQGFQDGKISNPKSVMTCVKHFGANGAVIGGREYTAQDVSERALRQDYLPPFKAAMDAGARCFMAGLNAPNGVPTIVNRRLLTDILRTEWGFRGFVMSDFDGIKAMVDHGVALDRKDAGRQAFLAGADVDMQSGVYIEELPKLVREGALSEKDIDVAVRRVLRVKEELGLFDDPHHGLDPKATDTLPPTKAALAAAQDIAEKSIVLLKNDNGTLPFKPTIKKLAVVGPLGDNSDDVVGAWSARYVGSEVVTLKQGLQKRLPDTKVTFVPGGRVKDSRDEEIAAAVDSARDADAVVIALGENFGDTGESQSRPSLDLPGRQMELARAVLALGKPTTVVIMAGRPLILTELNQIAPSIVNAWQLGTMTGPALARVLMGDVEPVGRLPVTYPRSLGQVPMSYDYRATGRPFVEPQIGFTAGYGDSTIRPLYPFGYGKTYTRFSLTEPKLDKTTLRDGETAKVSVDVMNDGSRVGTAMVQLYVGIKVARVAQPLKQLRGFKRVTLKPYERKTVELTVTPEDFAYWDNDNKLVSTAGPIEIMTGFDAGTVQTVKLDYKP